MQMQMRTPAEEREQDNHNTEFKKILQKLVDSKQQLVFGGITTDYESLVADCITYKPIEKKVVSPEIQAKILAGQELTQEELQGLL